MAIKIPKPSKSEVVYSDNPKMDTSGITAKRIRWGCVFVDDKEVSFDYDVVTGGKIYQDQLKIQKDFRKDKVITDRKSLRMVADFFNSAVRKK